MKDFFGFGGYTRQAEGYFSWQHLTFVTMLMVAMTVIAVIVGNKYKNKDDKLKNRPLMVAAILINVFELIKIVLLCFRSNDPLDWIYNLPLFVCSIQLITIPMAAFCKGRLKQASLDFVMIFGVLGALLGTYFAGQNYSSYPVISFDNVVSGITHAISGFSSLYIMIAGMNSMKRKNVICTFAIFISFCIAAYIVNVIIDYNYMFLMSPDGTPFELAYAVVGGNKILYPIFTAFLMLFYIFAYYCVYYFVMKLIVTYKSKMALRKKRLEKIKCM